MAIKIQINSLEALERLIGGDTEIELEMRNSIVMEFTQKHLKAIANEGFVKEVGLALEKEMKNQFLVYVKDSSSYNTSIPMLNDAVKAELRKGTTNYLKDLIKEIAHEELKIDWVRGDIAKALDASTTNILKELEPALLERRLNALVDQKIKEKLGLK